MSELYNKEMLVGTFLDLCPFGTTVTAGSGTDTVDEQFKPEIGRASCRERV